MNFGQNNPNQMNMQGMTPQQQMMLMQQQQQFGTVHPQQYQNMMQQFMTGNPQVTTPSKGR